MSALVQPGQEPVGVGAVWVVDAVQDTGVFEAMTSSTYTIVAIDGPLVTVEMEAVHQIDAELVAETLAPPDTEIEVVLTQTAFGSATWDLTSPVPIFSTLVVEQVLSATAEAP